MDDNTERLVNQVADDISKGLVSYDRAKRQLVEWGRFKPTIDIGEAIDWLDKNVKKSGHDEGDDGVSVKVDHSRYYDESKAANRELMAEQNHHRMIAGTNIDSGKLAKAQQRVIDVSARVRALNARADEEMGVIDG